MRIFAEFHDTGVHLCDDLAHRRRKTRPIKNFFNEMPRRRGMVKSTKGLEPPVILLGDNRSVVARNILREQTDQLRRNERVVASKNEYPRRFGVSESGVKPAERATSFVEIENEWNIAGDSFDGELG